MNPNGRAQRLLYASDSATGTVNVYSYKAKTLKLYGQLTGFEFPYGECVDKIGNVYVTDFGASDVAEYEHGGTTPLRTLAVQSYPIGCSVDSKSGNLAVSSFRSASGAGGVWVFRNASGTPVFYQDPNVELYWPPGYDNKGNLFVEGENGLTQLLDELPTNHNRFKEITLVGATVTEGASVMWDGHYVAVTDQAYQNLTTAIYRVSVSGSTGTVISTTQLTDNCAGSSEPSTDVVQPWITGKTLATKTVLGENIACTSRFDFWNYEDGGIPRRTMHAKIAPQTSLGDTVSP
jgi:hypothetical protein